jgi:tight adherence protein C
MNPLITGAAVGTTIASGMLIMRRAYNPAQPDLAELILNAAKPRPAKPTSTFDRGLDAIVTKGSDSTRIDADLCVLGRTRKQFAISRLTMAAAYGALPIAVAALTGTAAGASWNPILVILAALLGAGAGFGLGRATLASEANERRQGFVAELAAYLDIVAQLLTGGAGVEDALWRAARNARSPGIIAIRDTLASARTRRRSEWVALGELATNTRIPELSELVTAVQLAGSSGAKVAASLVTKAHSLRDRNASQQLAAAQRSSERMGGPLIAMLLSFLVLVIAPALAAVMSI